jgi:hypothetical protein
MKHIKETLFDIQVGSKIFEISETIRDFFYCQMLKPDPGLKELQDIEKCHCDLIQKRFLWN